MPTRIIRMEAMMWLSNQTPIEPPSMDTMNITKSMRVREEVGKISEAMRLAEEPAGEAKIKRRQTKDYRHARLLME